MTPIIMDAQGFAQLELEQYIEEQAVELAPEFEIDAIYDGDFGNLYRVWFGFKLLGTFYRTDIDGLWVAQPIESDCLIRCETPEEAQLLIITVSGLLVVEVNYKKINSRLLQRVVMRSQ